MFFVFFRNSVNLMLKTVTEISRIMFDHISGHHSPAKMTHEITPKVFNGLINM